MSALQRKYFGKRKKSKVSHSKPKKRVVYIARRKSYRSRGRSRSFGGMGGMKGLIAPIGAGVLENIINDYVPISGVSPTVVGMLMHDSTLKTLGLYQVGLSLGNIIPLPGGSGRTGGLL